MGTFLYLTSIDITIYCFHKFSDGLQFKIEAVQTSPTFWLPSHTPHTFQVNLVVSDKQDLGLMIRGGSEFGLGIYITGLDRNSVAENAGLKVCYFICYIINTFPKGFFS